MRFMRTAKKWRSAESRTARSADGKQIEAGESEKSKRGVSIEERTKDSLGFERNVTAASGAVFLVGLGAELWKKFFPKYVVWLGASVPVLDLVGTARHIFGAIHQSPGW